MIMKGKKFFSRAFALVLYITVEKWHVKSRRIFPPVFVSGIRDYSGNRPSYMMLNSP